jgi:general L-amino acid transport system permease protein
MKTGFDFLWITAGFDTDFHLIDYEAGDTYGRVYLVAILNSLLVAALAIVGTTLIGFFVGVLRLSSNWLVAKVAAAYVEILRNTPLLLQIIYWYLLLLAVLPRPKQSFDFLYLDVFFLNNRGLYGPTPFFESGATLFVLAIVIAIIAVVLLFRHARRLQDSTGRIIPKYSWGLAILVFVPLAAYFLAGQPIEWEVPELKGFNFRGGWRVPPAFITLLVALAVYHSAYMAESVRAGILSVNKGQIEAALSIGLKRGLALRLVIIPQAMRAIVPTMISHWMNVVKNSSLAVAIGYSEITALFMQTSLNQSGYAIEIVALTMLFYGSVSLTISAVLNVYNKRVQLVER